MKQKTQTLLKRNNELKDAETQLEILEVEKSSVQNFSEKIKNVGYKKLNPINLEILQVNLGYMCNQTCEHCHVDAGPDRKEITSKTTLIACLNVIDKTNIHTVDLTGGGTRNESTF